MTQRPILFSGPMVRAIREDRKWKTRRVVKLPKWAGANCIELNERDMPLVVAESTGCLAELPCPYGQPGDRLWVRETWAQPTSLDPGPTFYRADYPACVPSIYENVPTVDQVKWKPSIHMPRALSRITLEITDVRVERLNDISEMDALDEGVEVFHVDNGAGGRQFNVGDQWCDYARDAYQALWEQINGPGSWAANPWVWVVEFRRASK